MAVGCGPSARPCPTALPGVGQPHGSVHTASTSLLLLAFGCLWPQAPAVLGAALPGCAAEHLGLLSEHIPSVRTVWSWGLARFPRACSAIASVALFPRLSSHISPLLYFLFLL